MRLERHALMEFGVLLTAPPKTTEPRVSRVAQSRGLDQIPGYRTCGACRHQASRQLPRRADQSLLTTSRYAVSPRHQIQQGSQRLSKFAPQAGLGGGLAGRV